MLMGFFTFFRVLLDKKTMPQWPPVKLTCLRLKKLPHWPGQVAELTEAIQNSEQILEKNQTKNRLKAISWEMDGTWGNTYPQAELFRLVHYKLWFIGIVYVIVVHWQSICTRDIDMANRIRFICWLVTTTWYFLRVEISTPNQKNNYFASSDPHHDISKQLVDTTFVWSFCHGTFAQLTIPIICFTWQVIVHVSLSNRI